MENLRTLRELVKIDSSQNCDKIIDYIKDKLSEKVEEILEVEDKKCLFVGVNTKLKNQDVIILSGHIDTVKPSSEDQFDVRVENNNAYGLGIIDMKCFTSTIIDQINELKKIDFPIVCVFTTDEETNLYTVQTAIKKLKELNVRPVFSIIGEPSNMNFAVRSKGCYEYQLEVFGKPCHSSKPQFGINAIYIVSKVIAFIENLTKSYKETTMNCGVVCGGDIVNRVPEYAKLNFDVRCYDENEKLDVIEKIQNYIKELEIEYPGSKIKLCNMVALPSFNLKNRTLIQKISEKLGNEQEDFSGGCEAGYFQSYSGDAVIYGIGDTSLCHQPNENIEIDKYKEYQSKLLLCVKEIVEFIK